jgi:translation elongation factor aEF-1 beta
MANVVVTIKVTSESPDTDLRKLELELSKKILSFIKKDDPNFVKCETKPFAFGLYNLELMFVMDEALGSTEPLEEQLGETEGAQGVEVTDVRRMLG